MKKQLIVPAILLCFVSVATAQVFTIDPAGTPYIFRIYEQGLVAPTPSAPVEPFISRAGWIHFNMFSDGSFNDEEIVTKTFNSTGVKGVRKDRKGKYTSQTNPPHAARTITIPTNATATPPTNPNINSPFSLGATRIDSIHPEWGAAALTDTHYFAVVIKNPNQSAPQTGTLSLRFPTDAFDYIGTVFPPNPAIFGSPVDYTDSGDRNHRPGTVYTWPVNNLPPLDSQTIFIQLQVKDRVEDSLQLIQISSDFQSSNNPDDANTGTQIFFVKTDTEPRTENPYSFRQSNSTVVAINMARDPNGISVLPQRLPPASNAPAHKLVYTVHVENMGQAPAKYLQVDITFDPKINTGLLSTSATAMNFPNANTTSVDENIRFSSSVLGWNGSTLRLLFNNANLAPTGAGYYSKASFNVEIDTRSGIELREGEVLTSTAVIKMKSSVTATDDIVPTDPAFVHIEKAGKVPFGCVFGLKAHTNIFSPDSSGGARGVDLTFRFPIVNRRISDLSGKSFVPPHLFWQLEAGWGTGSFKDPVEGGLFETQYIHFSPVTIRYFQPFHAGSYFMYTGLSAGYGANYIYSGKLNGQSATLPSGFGNRLEHELALSIDLSTRIDVPAWTLGLGYKMRWNKVLDQSVNYKFPFIYLQLDIVRISQRLVRIWDKTRYCK